MTRDDKTILSNIARRLNLAAGATQIPHLYFMTDPVRTPDPVAAAGRLPLGCAVVLRHYDVPDRLSLAMKLKQVCRSQSLPLIVAGDARLAHAVKADGLHRPEWALRQPDVLHRQWRNTYNGLITAAVHSERALRLAGRFGVNAVVASPVFPTESHPDGGVLGAHALARWGRRSQVPVIALGGVSRLTAPQLIGTGCAGIAGIGGLIETKREMLENNPFPGKDL